MDFFLLVWQQEQEQENYNAGMRSLIFFALPKYVNFSVHLSPENVNFSTFTITGKPNDNQSLRIFFANAAFLLFQVANQIIRY